MANLRTVISTGDVMTRPANATPYAINDAISNGVAASTVAPTVTVTDANDGPFWLERLRLKTNDTGLGNGVSIRAWLFGSNPAANSGIVGDDNAAFSVKSGAVHLGTMSGAFRAKSDGGDAILVPDEGSRIIGNPVAGGRLIYILYQALSAFTPSGNSTTITPIIEGFQPAV